MPFSRPENGPGPGRVLNIRVKGGPGRRARAVAPLHLLTETPDIVRFGPGSQTRSLGDFVSRPAVGEHQAVCPETNPLDGGPVSAGVPAIWAR